MNKRHKSNNFPITCPPLDEESFIRSRPSRRTGTIGPARAAETTGETIAAVPAGLTKAAETTEIPKAADPGGGLTNLVEGNAGGSVRGIHTSDNYPMGENAMAIGLLTEAHSGGSFAQGFRTQAYGSFSHAEGYSAKTNAVAAHAEGAHTNAAGNFSHTEGLATTDGGYNCVHIMGRYGIADRAYSWFLGNGSLGIPGLSAKILDNGNAYIDVAWNGGGADYAELFETESGQPIEPGYFVTFSGTSDKIRIAQAYDEYVLGVVSRAPGFVAGGGELRWKNKFKTDEWGGMVYEDVTVPDETDDHGNVIVPSHVETRPALNPGYDPGRDYVPRDKRPEWVKVGLLGRLLVRDDGTLTAGGYCRPGMNGIAAAAHTGYRVLKRTGPNQVMILLR